MNEAVVADTFYKNLPKFSGFADLIDPGLYQSLPDDWLIGLTDVVSSTAAIARGQYKSVNMAGAAIVAALMNGLGTMDFPYVFGGDGVSFAVSGEDAPWAREALATTGAFVRDELGHQLRTALVPVSAIRAAGKDVQVARYAPSANVSYAMFRGGGIAWAEAEMKQGAYAIAHAGVGIRPELTGLSCRWDASPARNGVMLSVIIVPAADDSEAFRSLVSEVLALTADSSVAARPFADQNALSVKWPAEGLDMEIRANRTRRESRRGAKIQHMVLSAIQTWMLNGNRTVGQFNAVRYKDELIANADFRKYDDGLRFTLDCTPALADALEARLQTAEQQGIARFGLHRQDAAIVTCLVVTATRADHVHFIDGASGGYAAAAQRLKASAKA